VEPSKLSAPAANKIGPVNSSAPVRLKNGSSDSTVNDAPSPSLTGIVPTESSSLPNLIAQGNAPTPVLQTVNISQGVSQGLILKKVQPAYSANALRLRIEGPVQLLATISKSGEVSIVKVVSGDRQLASSAIDAVKQWKYKPYLLNGSPVEVQTQITINFKLPH
jgi:protein TonB